MLLFRSLWRVSKAGFRCDSIARLRFPSKRMSATRSSQATISSRMLWETFLRQSFLGHGLVFMPPIVGFSRNRVNRR